MEAWVYDITYERSGNDKKGTGGRTTSGDFLSVQEGDYSIERGAQKSNMSEKEFEELMVKEGYKLPAEA